MGKNGSFTRAHKNQSDKVFMRKLFKKQSVFVSQVYHILLPLSYKTALSYKKKKKPNEFE